MQLGGKRMKENEGVVRPVIYWKGGDRKRHYVEQYKNWTAYGESEVNLVLLSGRRKQIAPSEKPKDWSRTENSRSKGNGISYHLVKSRTEKTEYGRALIKKSRRW